MLELIAARTVSRAVTRRRPGQLEAGRRRLVRHDGGVGRRGAITRPRGPRPSSKGGTQSWSCIRRTTVRSSSEVIARTRNFAGMHPTMQERLQALHGGLRRQGGLGPGCADTAAAVAAVPASATPRIPRERSRGTGEKYSRHPECAAAVPPGRSMHEVGLAADMAGDFAWLGKNVGRFGLMTFADVNKEPWHVQPVELPKGRQQYEQQGSKWGAYPTYDVESRGAQAHVLHRPARLDGADPSAPSSRCADPHPGAGRPTRRRRPGGTSA